MTDIFDKKKRSSIMARVKNMGNKSTELKMVVLLRKKHITGWRRHLPLVGKPDFTFPKERVCVFVDGCFWHGCRRCYGGKNPKHKMPVSNADFWREKITANMKRDQKNSRKLRSYGYSVLRVKGCELNNEEQVAAKIMRKLNSQGRR